MDLTGSNTRPACSNPVVFKDYPTEIKRLGLERLLSGIYRQDLTLFALLRQQGLSETALDSLKYRGLGGVADRLIEEIKTCMRAMPQGERRFAVIERFYGLDGKPPSNLSVIATRDGVSRERIRQIKERSLMALRAKKSIIETALTNLAMQAYGQRRKQFSIAPCVGGDEQHSFKLKKHSELLMMHGSTIPFTDEQRRIVQAIGAVPRALVAGCAGSGKTMMALLLALHLHSQGKRVLLTCFNRTLADYFMSVLPEQKNLVVGSFHSICLRMAKQGGLSVPGGWNNRAYVERFPDVLEKAMLLNASLRFDAIVIDDAQQFRENWWRALEFCLVNPMRSRMYCFMDDNKQVTSNGVWLPDVDLTARLSVNLRNPVSVSPFLSPAYVAPYPMRYIKEMIEPIEFYRCESEEEVKLGLTHVFSQLLDKGDYVASEVAILTNRMPRFSDAHKVKLRSSARLVRKYSDALHHCCFSRAQAFFGLEKRAAIIVDIDNRFSELPIEDMRTFIYCAFSRFSERLIILGSKQGWQAIEALSKHPRQADQKYGLAAAMSIHQHDGVRF